MFIRSQIFAKLDFLAQIFQTMVQLKVAFILKHNLHLQWILLLKIKSKQVFSYQRSGPYFEK